MTDDTETTAAIDGMRAHVSHLLEQEGYRGVELDEDGDVRFKAEGRSLLMIFNTRDPGYLRLALPNFWPIDDDAERTHAYRIGNGITRDNKCVSVFVTPNENVWATAEWLTTGPEAIDGAMLVRLTEMLLAAAGEFHREMQAAG
ncbi:hypothetical protein ACFSGX_03045 [Sphingomonas arantia]|uniref:YbjN domain-containing protein n=1 Tax=Sphingomonas arantia TaxID=1460676 RepID=A0ABW4TWE2_9SPHN